MILSPVINFGILRIEIRSILGDHQNNTIQINVKRYGFINQNLERDESWD
jgi:hypothetical protein